VAIAAAVALFLLTLVSTTTLGGIWTLLARVDVVTDLNPYYLTLSSVRAVWTDPELRRAGLQFAAAALFILLCHEMGHWIACRRHRLPATLPFFLPAPVGLGTFGAFIRIRAPVRSKRQLLDVGVAGPLAGFVALLPILVLGVAWSHPVSLSASRIPAGYVVELYRPGESLLLTGLTRLLHGHLGSGEILNPHPFLLAGWFGLFATMLNLLPLAQLDGGHILYAAAGRWQRRWAWPLWAVVALLGFFWPGWWLWSVIVLLMGVRHPRVVDEEEKLDPRRRRLAVAALVVLVLSFMPGPIRIAVLEAKPDSDAPALLVGRQIEDQRHRSVVEELELHAGAEAALLDPGPRSPQDPGQAIDQGSRLLRRRRALERGAAAARGGSQQGELRYQQYCTAALAEIAIEATAIVLEEPQPEDLLRRSPGLSLSVAPLDADQDGQPRSDRGHALALHLDSGPRHPLQDETHRFRPFFRTQPPRRAAMIATRFEESTTC